MPESTIVSTATLAAHLGDPTWIVLDCRHDLTRPDAGPIEYRQGHVPGALFVHMDHDLAGPKTGSNGRHPMPTREAFAATLGRLGIDHAKQVIAYDAQAGVMAARLWWMLRWMGHRAVAVLDGGLQRWTADGRALETNVPIPHATQFVATPVDNCVDAEFLQSQLGSDRTLVVDARAPDRFRGENETLDPVGGRIPGARNRFYRDNLDAGGRFRDPAALRADFERLLGALSPSDTVHSCGSGVSACHNLLAMEIAGLSGGRLYPGSWSEWCADTSRPWASGPA